MSTPTDHDEEVEEREELSGQMSFLDHLEELRRRIINSLIAIGVAFGLCWWLADRLFSVFSRLITSVHVTVADPATGQPVLLPPPDLNMTKITEAFSVELKLAVMAAVFLAAPFILAQVWLFISPGLYARERRYAVPFVVFSSVLFIVGGLFGYFYAIPFALEFLIQFGTNLGLKTLLSVSEAFDLVIALELGLGVVFEIPALIFLLSRLGLVTGSFLLKNTKYAVLACFVVAAVITPTGDIPNMMVIAVPMLALYMLGVIIAFVFGKKRPKE